MNRARHHVGGLASAVFLLLITVAVTSGTVFADSNETPSGSARSSQQGSITLGGDHTCALLSTGSVKCWGLNDLGQLGDGTTTSRSLPVDVLVSLGGSPLTGVTAISAGTSHTCALLSTGSVKCWGYNGDGEFGNGTTTNSSLPVDVLVSLGGSPLTGVSAITAGAYHTCALLSTGSVRCWGLNNYGQIGDGTSGAGTNRLAPTAVLVSLGGSPLTGVSAITAGAYHTCALVSTGSVKCWGYNGAGEFGNGTTTNSSLPVDTLVSLGGSPLTGVSAITANGYHTCALLSTSALKCWGDNWGGSIGDGTTASRSLPTDVLVSLGGSPLTGVSAVTASTSFTCALMATGRVKCWGYNGDGELGDGTTTDRSLPTDVLVSLGGSPLTGVSAISSGTEHMCGLLDDGTVKCWGSNEFGQLGDGTDGAGIRSVVPAHVLVSLGGSPLPNVGPSSTTSTIAPTTTTLPATTSEARGRLQTATSLPSTGGGTTALALISTVLVTSGLLLTGRRRRAR